MNTNISCDICRDLIPLVLDGVSSEDSRAAVETHVAHCPDCAALFGGQAPLPPQPDDKAIWSKIQKRLSTFLIIVIISGTALGLALSNSFHMFYNILIMPAIGILAYMAFRKRTYVWNLVLFVLTYLWFFFIQLIDLLSSGQPLAWYLFTAPFFFAILYSFFFLLGAVIAHLLFFVFGKEHTNET